MTGNRHLRTLVLALAATVGAAGALAAGSKPTTWTVDDMLLAETASGWTISPDGALAAWVRSTVEKVDDNENRVSNLWLARLADGTSFAMTRGQGDALSRGAPACASSWARKCSSPPCRTPPRPPRRSSSARSFDLVGRWGARSSWWWPSTWRGPNCWRSPSASGCWLPAPRPEQPAAAFPSPSRLGPRWRAPARMRAPWSDAPTPRCTRARGRGAIT